MQLIQDQTTHQFLDGYDGGTEWKWPHNPNTAWVFTSPDHPNAVRRLEQVRKQHPQATFVARNPAVRKFNKENPRK